jgi:putative tricarboxylic transport membrane protein
MKIADRMVAVILLAFAVYVGVGSLSMEYATKGVPGPGFLPFWISLFLGGAAVLILVQGWTKPLAGPLIADRGVLWRTLALGLGIAGMAFLIPFIGMILAMALFILGAVPLLGAKKWMHILAAVVLVPAFVYLLFQYILQVPLPVMPWRS